MSDGDENRGGMGADVVRWEQLNNVVNDSVNLESHSCDVNGKIPDEPFEIDKRLLIDPTQLLVGPKIGEGAHGKVYKGR